MKRSVVFYLALVLLVLATACNREAKIDIDTSPNTKEVSPTTPPGFKVEGVVLEASGSAQTSVTGTAATTTPVPRATSTTPAPGASTTTSPNSGSSTSSTPSVRPTVTTTTTRRVTTLKGAPGSIAVRLSSFSSDRSDCSFGKDDALVVAFVSSTQFTPSDLTDKPNFPNNLKGLSVSISGIVQDDGSGGCLFIATAVEAGSAAATPTRARTSTTPSPSTKPSASPSPTR